MEKIRVIYKQPAAPAQIVEIPNTLAALQEAVGGYIEAVTLTEDTAMICNEEGRLKGMAPNLTLCGVEFVGPILMVGVDQDEFVDLGEAAVEFFMGVFEFCTGDPAMDDFIPFSEIGEGYPEPGRGRGWVRKGGSR